MEGKKCYYCKHEDGIDSKAIYIVRTVGVVGGVYLCRVCFDKRSQRLADRNIWVERITSN